MKIIITEEQYDKLNEEQLKNFLHSFWDKQKRKGEECLHDIIYTIIDTHKESRKDYDIIRPIWYEYNGGYDIMLEKLKDRIEGKNFKINGYQNLNMDVLVTEVYSYGESNTGGMVDISCKVKSGTVDGYIYDEDGDFQEVGNMDIFDQYSMLEYDTADFEQFLTDETEKYFDELTEDIGIPIHIDLMFR